MEDTPRVTLQDFYKASERPKRISVDIDKGSLKPLQVFFMLKSLFPNSKVTAERTRHGFHIKAVGDEIRDIPIAKRLDLREILGDDSMRVDCDRRKLMMDRPYAVDTLFSLKCNFKGEWSMTQPEDVTALPYYPKLPARKIRIVERS